MVFEVRGVVFTTPSKKRLHQTMGGGTWETQDWSQVVNKLSPSPFAAAGSKVVVHENDIGWIIWPPHVVSKTCSLEFLQGVGQTAGSNRYFGASLSVTEIYSVVWSSRDSLWPCVMHWLQLARHWQAAAWVMMWVQGFCLAKVTTLRLRGTCKILKTQQ